MDSWLISYAFEFCIIKIEMVWLLLRLINLAGFSFIFQEILILLNFIVLYLFES